MTLKKSQSSDPEADTLVLGLETDGLERRSAKAEGPWSARSLLPLWYLVGSVPRPIFLDVEPSFESLISQSVTSPPLG